MTSSWVPGADESGFSLANLPYGVAEPSDGAGHRLVVAIGDQALDLAACAERGLLSDIAAPASTWDAATLNPFLGLDDELHRATRRTIIRLLSDTGALLRPMVEACLIERASLTMACALDPHNFVDFYSSYHHAARAMAVGQPDARPHPNWASMPVGYHSRSSSVTESEAMIDRPWGQFRKRREAVFAPTEALDFELELGYVLKRGSRRGTRIGAAAFADHVFGLVLLNDWSARDLQYWESPPLGPFLAKSFATQVGAWVVPLEALGDYRWRNSSQSDSLDYLRHDEPWSFDLGLEVALESELMRQQGLAPHVVTRSNFIDMYWDGAQQLAHMTANGAATRVGDLYGSGTVSGPTDDSAGCLLELTAGGKPLIGLPDGTGRGWLQDGDRVILNGRCQAPGCPTIDFGEISGVVAPASLPV